MKYAKHAIRIEPAEWYDLAIVGMSEDKVLIYSKYRLIDVCMLEQGFDHETALDWVEFNIEFIPSDKKPGFRVSYARKHQWSLPLDVERIKKSIRHQYT